MDKSLAFQRTALSRLPASVKADAAFKAAGDKGIMFFLLRLAFWLSIVLILLPSATSQPGGPANQVDAGDAVSAASATVSDLRQFCSRQPDACSVGGKVAMSIGYKVQAGAKMLYEFLTEQLAPRETGSIEGAKTDRPHGPQKASGSSQNTLTPTDLAPAWRGPTPRKDAKHAA
jgi:hypothetical protein